MFASNYQCIERRHAKNKNEINKLQLVVCRGSYALGILNDVLRNILITVF